MKRAIFFGLIFTAILQFASAQTKSNAVTVHWGEEEKASKKSTLSDIVGHDDSGVYVLKVEYKKLGVVTVETLEHYDHDMNLQRSLELGDIEFIVYQNDQILFSHPLEIRRQNGIFSTLKV